MLEDILYVKATNMKLIGDLIPEGKTTLIHGRSGSGKTLSIIKYMIQHGVKPLFIDFDYNDEYDDMNMVHIDGFKLVEEIAKGNEDIFKLLQSQVVIVDTYRKASMALEEKELYDVVTLCDKINSLGSTVVVVSHTSYYSGKPAEPDCDITFANHVACRLHLHNEVKKTKTDINLEVEKLRGMSSKMIPNWMRGQTIDHL